jgi:hypothetical protein
MTQGTHLTGGRTGINIYRGTETRAHRVILSASLYNFICLCYVNQPKEIIFSESYNWQHLEREMSGVSIRKRLYIPPILILNWY